MADVVSLLNLGALILGLIAWALPVVSLFTKRNTAAGSFALCGISLLLETMYTQHLVDIGDWSAMEDTHYAVTFAAKTLVIITAALNFLAFVVRKRKG